jgi:hypothetical protein
LLREVDQPNQADRTHYDALNDKRHLGYIKHSMSDLLQQRIYQIGSGYEDGNDSNSKNLWGHKTQYNEVKSKLDLIVFSLCVFAFVI